MPMNGALSDSSIFLADFLRGGDLPAGVGVGDAETIAAITNSSTLTFGIIVFMYVTFLVVRCNSRCVTRISDTNAWIVGNQPLISAVTTGGLT